MIPLVLFGTGGHAKVLVDIAEKMGTFKVLGLFDDSQSAPAVVLGYPVLGGRDQLLEFFKKHSGLQAIVAIGNNKVRCDVSRWLREQGLQMTTLIHPSAQLGKEVSIEDGSVIMAGVVVNSSTRIGHDVILNTRCSVDHDCIVEDGAHVAPGVSLCGGVSIGKSSLIGTGAQVIPGIRIGNDVIVGAGSTVIENLADNCKVVGSPAKKIQ